MIEKRKILSISLNADLVKELRRASKEHKMTLSRTIEDVILWNKAYKKEIIPQIAEVRALLKKLRIKNKLLEK